jgi:hypothetical protein
MEEYQGETYQKMRKKRNFLGIVILQCNKRQDGLH